jgi:hypothetical protein
LFPATNLTKLDPFESASWQESVEPDASENATSPVGKSGPPPGAVSGAIGATVATNSTWPPELGALIGFADKLVALAAAHIGAVLGTSSKAQNPAALLLVLSVATMCWIKF